MDHVNNPCNALQNPYICLDYLPIMPKRYQYWYKLDDDGTCS